MKTTFDLNFVSNFQTAWIHKNTQTIRSCQLKKPLFNYFQTFKMKKACLQVKLEKVHIQLKKYLHLEIGIVFEHERNFCCLMVSFRKNKRLTNDVDL